MTKNLLNEAQRWNQLGITTIPIQAKNKHIDIAAIKARGHDFSDLKSTLPTLDDLRYWFADGKRKLAVICSNLICVDIDDPAQYEKLRADHRPLTYTFTVKSPRGIHLYYWLDKIVKPFNITWSNTEIKHSGQAIITAGNGYEVINNGLLSKYTMLRLNSVYVLPFVEPKRTITPTKKEKIGAFSSFRGCKNAASDPIGKIKSSLPIGVFLEQLGHELKPLPNNRYITSCPFHNDHQPSFWVDDNTQTCNCYRGDCQRSKSMDVLDLYRNLHRCTLGRAIFELSNSLGF